MLRLVKVDRLNPGDELGDSLYNAKGGLLMNKGAILTISQIERLRSMEIHDVTVADPLLKDLADPSLITPHTRTTASLALSTFFERLQGGNAIGSLGELQDAAKNIAEDIKEGRPHFISLSYIHAPGHYLVAHSLYTAVLSAALAHLSGYHDHLPDIALGGLLSDAGLMLLPRAILDKPSPLDQGEKEKVKQHPVQALKALGNSSAYSKTIVFQHHERSDGSGYPKGSNGPEIHPYSQLVGLADIYVAMLANRPYRPQILPHATLEQIMGMAGWEFNHALVQAFVRAVPPYPVGTFVRLNSGEDGVITDLSDLLTRPKLRILHDAEGKEINPYDLNLADKDNQTTLIKEILD